MLIQQASAPCTTYVQQTAALTGSSQSFRFPFTASAGGATCAKFLCGGSDTEVYLDTISLTS